MKVEGGVVAVVVEVEGARRGGGEMGVSSLG